MWYFLVIKNTHLKYLGYPCYTNRFRQINLQIWRKLINNHSWNPNFPRNRNLVCPMCNKMECSFGGTRLKWYPVSTDIAKKRPLLVQKAMTAAICHKFCRPSFENKHPQREVQQQTNNQSKYLISLKRHKYNIWSIIPIKMRVVFFFWCFR